MIKPQDYEYLWTDYDVNFIFTSCYLFKEFKKTDIILLYDWRNKGLSFFLSKKDHIGFSKYGLRFFRHLFPQWKVKIKKNIQFGKKIIEQTNQEKENVHRFSLHLLKKRFIDCVKLFQALGGNYFYTEFFFLDAVERLIKNQHLRSRDKAIVVTLKRNLREMSVLKFNAREILNNFYNYDRVFKLYVDEIGKRFKRSDLQWLSYQEILCLIDGKNVPLSSRALTNWLLAKKTQWALVTGEHAETTFKSFTSFFFNKNTQQVQGTVANKGFYTGTVKVLRTIFSDTVNKEMRKMKKGDVLVANTTGPEVMIACEKAGAIVTDEGGITSHAAIVSRELDIPCIVGTKHATLVFKDGDIVEVDANKGIVRKCVRTS